MKSSEWKFPSTKSDDAKKEFQVDEAAQKRAAQKRSLEALKTSLALTRGVGQKRY